MLASNVFTAAKAITSSGAQPMVQKSNALLSELTWHLFMHHFLNIDDLVGINRANVKI